MKFKIQIIFGNVFILTNDVSYCNLYSKYKNTKSITQNYNIYLLLTLVHDFTWSFKIKL